MLDLAKPYPIKTDWPHRSMEGQIWLAKILVGVFEDFRTKANHIGYNFGVNLYLDFYHRSLGIKTIGTGTKSTISNHNHFTHCLTFYNLLPKNKIRSIVLVKILFE